MYLILIMLFQLNVLTKFFTSKLFLCLPKVGHMIKSCKEPIRKQISPLRNLSSWWISFEKSKFRFHGFPFHQETTAWTREAFRNGLVAVVTPRTRFTAATCIRDVGAFCHNGLIRKTFWAGFTNSKRKRIRILSWLTGFTGYRNVVWHITSTGNRCSLSWRTFRTRHTDMFTMWEFHQKMTFSANHEGGRCSDNLQQNIVNISWSELKHAKFSIAHYENISKNDISYKNRSRKAPITTL